MKTTNMKTISYQLTTAFGESRDINDPYDCYDFERTMTMIQPYLLSLTDEQQEQIERIRIQMIKKDAPPKEIIREIMHKIKKFNETNDYLPADIRFKRIKNA